VAGGCGGSAVRGFHPRELARNAVGARRWGICLRRAVDFAGHSALRTGLQHETAGDAAKNYSGKPEECLEIYRREPDAN